MTRTHVVPLICAASLLLTTPALAGSWNNYNANYGKGASFSKGTMVRNGTGASIRHSSGGTRGLTGAKTTPKRSFAVIKHESNTYRLTRKGAPKGKRSLLINNSLEVVGQNRVKVHGQHWTAKTVNSLVNQHGGRVTFIDHTGAKITGFRFKAPKQSLLSRLGGIVHRVNQPTRQARQKPAADNKTSGNPLYTSPTSNPEHGARALQPGYKDGNTTTRAGYLREHGTNGRWGHGRYRTR